MIYLPAFIQVLLFLGQKWHNLKNSIKRPGYWWSSSHTPQWQWKVGSLRWTKFFCLSLLSDSCLTPCRHRWGHHMDKVHTFFYFRHLSQHYLSNTILCQICRLATPKSWLLKVTSGDNRKIRQVALSNVTMIGHEHTNVTQSPFLFCINYLSQ